LEEVQELFDGPGAISALVEAELEHHADVLKQDSKMNEDVHQIEYAK
jgi:hypothetical protein